MRKEEAIRLDDESIVVIARTGAFKRGFEREALPAMARMLIQHQDRIKDLEEKIDELIRKKPKRVAGG